MIKETVSGGRSNGLLLPQLTEYELQTRRLTGWMSSHDSEKFFGRLLKATEPIVEDGTALDQDTGKLAFLRVRLGQIVWTLPDAAPALWLGASVERLGDDHRFHSEAIIATPSARCPGQQLLIRPDVAEPWRLANLQTNYEFAKDTVDWVAQLDVPTEAALAEAA